MVESKRSFSSLESKIIRHSIDLQTGEHRQWRVENYGTDEEKEIEIFKGDPDWEE